MRPGFSLRSIATGTPYALATLTRVSPRLVMYELSFAGAPTAMGAARRAMKDSARPAPTGIAGLNAATLRCTAWKARAGVTPPVCAFGCAAFALGPATPWWRAARTWARTAFKIGLTPPPWAAWAWCCGAPTPETLLTTGRTAALVAGTITSSVPPAAVGWMASMWPAGTWPPTMAIVESMCASSDVGCHLPADHTKAFAVPWLLATPGMRA
jgi:hypothetical protein